MIFSLVFVIQQKQLQEELSAVLENIADPASRSYGQYLSKQDIMSRSFDPTVSVLICRFLSLLGISQCKPTPFRDYVIATATAATWNKLLGTNLRSHVGSCRSNQRCSFPYVPRGESYTVPTLLSDYVEGVLGIYDATIAETSSPYHHWGDQDEFYELLSQGGRVRGSTEQEQGLQLSLPGMVTPLLIKKYYDITDSIGSNITTQSIYGALDQTVGPADLARFQRLFSLPAQDILSTDRDHFKHVNDSTCQQNVVDCLEANLDVQYLMSTARLVPTTYDYWDNVYDPFLSWIIYVANFDKPPIKVISISYGAEEKYIPPLYARVFNLEAQKLALQGVTLVAASGDNGALSMSTLNSSRPCSYAVMFPASSPYVLAVGATKGPETLRFDGSFGEEKVCQAGKDTLITSGGGFSSLYSRPTYQDEVVTKYFSTIKAQSSSLAPIVKGYHEVGRGVPDISLLGHNYLVVVAGKSLLIDGTSASAPTMAGMISLINHYRVEQGLSTLGWIHPLLYRLASRPKSSGGATEVLSELCLKASNNVRTEDHSHDFPASASFLRTEASLLSDVGEKKSRIDMADTQSRSAYPPFLRDIISGDNRCTRAIAFDPHLGYIPRCCAEGFTAVPGWDPVTGLGSILSFSAMQLAMGTNHSLGCLDEDGGVNRKSSVVDTPGIVMFWLSRLFGLFLVVFLFFVLWRKRRDCWSWYRGYESLSETSRHMPRPDDSSIQLPERS